MLPPDTDILDYLLTLVPHVREEMVRAMGIAEADGFDGSWPVWAHDGQREPACCPDGSAWNVWVLKGGRGFGKTLTGAKWIEAAVAAHSSPSGARQDDPVRLRIALVGATLAEARGVMVEGNSGLLEVAGHCIREWRPSLGLIRFRGGAEARLFSGHSPELLRGPEHHLAWCDELAKWEKPRETWDMLQLGLRLGDHPRILVTTTPRPGPVLRRIMAAPGCVTTGGPTRANPHVSPAWQQNMADLYAGTRLGRQELEGELLTDSPGALWTVELLEKCRLHPVTGLIARPERSAEREVEGRMAQSPVPAPLDYARDEREGDSASQFTRIVIAVDPPSGDGTCGIIACARDAQGRAHVLADHSVTACSPEGWSRAVADAARIWSSPFPEQPIPLIVAEANQGGKMVDSVLRTADPNLRVKMVTATVGKSERAAPVAMLFEAGKVSLHGQFPELEAELLGMIAGGEYEGPGTSPDRADAMVWGLTELMLAPERTPPRVRVL